MVFLQIYCVYSIERYFSLHLHNIILLTFFINCVWLCTEALGTRQQQNPNIGGVGLEELTVRPSNLMIR